MNTIRKHWFKTFFILAFVGVCYTYCWGAKLSDYPLTDTLTNSDLIPVVASGTNKNVNWINLKELVSRGINWQDVNNGILHGSTNWTDLREFAKTLNGINWTDLSPQGYGINWYAFSNGAAVGTINCTRSDGHPGKCAGSITGTSCASCN